MFRFWLLFLLPSLLFCEELALYLPEREPPELLCSFHEKKLELPLYYYREKNLVNFGDYLSLKLVERMIKGPVRVYQKRPNVKERKLLAIGSILSFAADGDVVWGSGIHGKVATKQHHHFSHLDVRAVRGPLTRHFLLEHFGIETPEVYGDPALLVPMLFPEFQRSAIPEYDVLIIPHYSEAHLFPKSLYPNVVYPTDAWDEIITKITKSAFVISSSLHGIVVAEAFGIPARLLRLTENPHIHILKFQDYYHGTGRPNFRCAYSVEEALAMGGEPPIQCNLQRLYDAFPFEFWPECMHEARLPLS